MANTVIDTAIWQVVVRVKLAPNLTGSIVSANPDDPDCMAVRSYDEGAVLAVADVAAEGFVAPAQAEALIAAGAVEPTETA